MRMTEREWIDHWLSQAPSLTEEKYEEVMNRLAAPPEEE